MVAAAARIRAPPTAKNGVAPPLSSSQAWTSSSGPTPAGSPNDTASGALITAYW
jgi:hypothetical protein